MSKQKSKHQQASQVGRPSKWQSSPTTNIRVPESLAEKLLEIAHELDWGLSEPMIIQPDDFKIHRQEKHASMNLQNIRVYRASGQNVLRISELLAALTNVSSG